MLSPRPVTGCTQPPPTRRPERDVGGQRAAARLSEQSVPTARFEPQPPSPPAHPRARPPRELAQRHAARARGIYLQEYIPGPHARTRLAAFTRTPLCLVRLERAVCFLVGEFSFGGPSGRAVGADGAPCGVSGRRNVAVRRARPRRGAPRPPKREGHSPPKSRLSPTPAGAHSARMRARRVTPRYKWSSRAPRARAARGESAQPRRNGGKETRRGKGNVRTRLSAQRPQRRSYSAP